MPQCTILETDQFLSDVEDSAVWILESNLEFSEDFAVQKVDEFQEEIEAVKERLQSYPESGEWDVIKGVRKLPIYNGRYSLQWIVQIPDKSIILIALTDSKYPKVLRNIQLKDF
jgi:plasmid stabilization system protein ParE